MGKAWERVRGVALLLTMCTGGLLITAVTLLEWPFAALFDKTYRVLHVYVLRCAFLNAPMSLRRRVLH